MLRFETKLSSLIWEIAEVMEFLEFWRECCEAGESPNWISTSSIMSLKSSSSWKGEGMRLGILGDCLGESNVKSVMV